LLHDITTETAQKGLFNIQEIDPSRTTSPSIFYHTNHYISETLKDIPQSISESSKHRLQRITDIVSQGKHGNDDDEDEDAKDIKLVNEHGVIRIVRPEEKDSLSVPEQTHLDSLDSVLAILGDQEDQQWTIFHDELSHSKVK
jgi:hypothetical protein